MVRKSKPVIIWNNRASNYFKKAYEHIKKKSFNNAEVVKNEITMAIDSLIDHPEKHPPDKYKKNNPGNYRAFEKHSLRISYNTPRKKSEYCE